MRRHTVILGAGATIAAIPNGDKNGKKSSVMNGLIEKLQLQNILDGVKLKTNKMCIRDRIWTCYPTYDSCEALSRLFTAYARSCIKRI